MILKDKIEIIPRKFLKDERGWLFKTLTGTEKGLPNYTGEIYTVCGLPNQIRGGHYHKEATEWFTIIGGEATLKLKDILTLEELTLKLSIEEPITIVVPPLVAHQFENPSDKEFLLLAYSNLLYDPKDTIIFNL
ncbi:WxcM-like domain-containing protein [Pedobacter rhodius]|uniref:WxcM-like domain-containing protein n=1 Tax=Pedobacter rhodius TaxID=3004098 RepID=A0ABT4L067_9SPHI|nr:WxcM-like domain-containing protein [Pedobacter sp. SJ11]MCZ4224371.1 WxcM-like domain-containing protein [Pedobacter sp. SJ11]